MENIQVALRVRPLNRKELQKNYENIWNIPKLGTVTLSSSSSREHLASKKVNCIGRTTFYFDQCFAPGQSNIHVYHQSVKRIVLSSLNGINGTIFMYGQTGSGKTYTMMGSNKSRNQMNNVASSLHERDVSPNNYRSCPPLRKQTTKRSYLPETENYQSTDRTENGSYLISGVTENTGVLIMGLRDIFETIENDMDKTYFLRCSYVEIYNDQVFDLLKPAERLTETLSVGEDANKEFFIKGVTEESISSIEEVLEKLRKGEANRTYARTAMNHTSSRSHTIFRLTVQSVTNNFIREYRREKSRSSTNINNFELRSQFSDSCEGGTKMEGTIVTESLLNFVDLAGSEKVTHHQMMLEESGFLNIEQGGIYGRESMLAVNKMKERVKEGQHINKSLFFLTQVISLKSEGKNNQYIPYRNSPLTKILRSSLGGNSRTLIILCITPACAQFEQTMSTLRFGMSAKKIENKVQANIVTRDDAAGLKLLISEYEKKLKDSEIARQEEHSKYHSISRQVEELITQKNYLMDKLNNFCRSKVTKMADSVSYDDLSVFYRQVKDRSVYLNKVGVVFSGQLMNKYDKLNNSSFSMTFREHLKRNLTRRQDREFEDEEEGNNKTGFRLGRDDADQVEESMNKLYTKFLKAYKEQNELLKKKLELYEKNADTVCERNVLNFSNYLQYSSSFETLRKQFKETSNNYKQEAAKLTQLKMDLQLYVNLKGISELDEDGLTRLEKSFWERLDQIKMERARRIVMREMSVASIGKENTQSDLNTENTFNRNIFETQNEDEQGGWIYFEKNESSASHNTSSNLELLEKIKRERELVRNIMSEGTEDIDKELEATRQTLLNNKDIISLYQDTNDSDLVPKKVPSIATKKIERGERSERDVSLSSYRQKLSVRKGSGNQSTAPSKCSNVLTNLPKLDLGKSVLSVPIEHDIPKLPEPEHSVLMISTKRINTAKFESPRAFEGEFGALKSQRRGRSENRDFNNYSFDSKELKVGGKSNRDVALHSKNREETIGNRKSTPYQSSNQNKDQARMAEEDKKKELKHSASTNSAKQFIAEKPLVSSVSSTALAKQYQTNPSSLTSLQNKLSKHLSSLEKYFIKPVSTNRRSRSIRAEQNSIIHYETTTRTATDNSFIIVNKSRTKDESTGKVKLEEEFEYKEESEGEQKMNESVIHNDTLKGIVATASKRNSICMTQKKRVQDENIENPCSNDVSNVEDPRTLLEIKEAFPDRFGLNITNIEKEETMFTNSIFSIKELDTVAKEKDQELLNENNVLKQLENILQKAEHSVELGDCSDFPLDQSKKRRRRADRLKKSADKTANV